MTRYIDADDLFTADGIKNIGKTFDEVSASGILRKKHKVEELVNAIPTADVVPVIHAHWNKFRNFKTAFECSNCLSVYSECCDDAYCRNCGAKMDGMTECEGANVDDD